MKLGLPVIAIVLLGSGGVSGLGAGSASVGCRANETVTSVCLGNDITRDRSSSVDAPNSTALCRSAALEPLETLGGRVFVVRRAGFSTPRLVIRWRAKGIADRCGRSGGRRSIAVSVRVQTSGSHGFIPIGLGKGERQWLTFARGFEARPLTKTLATGYSFDEALGCIKRVRGLVRYRFESSAGVRSQRFFPYHPQFERCSSGAA
jgi:hypothetical protein